MFHVVLYQPEIPPNTGNSIRLCANTGATLHLVEPLGFDLDEPRLRRAGLDYHEYADVQVHADVDQCLCSIGHPQVLAFSSKASTRYTDVVYTPGAVLLFGPETRGLPSHVLDRVPQSSRLTVPMMPGNRSLNLSNAVAVVVYEGWRQNGFRD